MTSVTRSHHSLFFTSIRITHTRISKTLFTAHFNVLLLALISLLSTRAQANTFFEAGNTCYRNKQYNEAATLYREALKELPESADIHFNLGITLIEKKELTHAIEHLNHALRYNPRHTKALLQLAKIHYTQKQKDAALDLLQKAAAIDPDFLDIQYELASFFSEEQQYERALTHANLLVAKQPDNIHYNFQRANILNMANYTQEALDGYKKILEKHPDNVSVLYNVAYTLKKLGRIQEAMPYYHKVLERNPEHIEAHFSLGLAYLISGDFKRGWPKYEWRWRRSAQEGSERRYVQPLWDGSPLNGKKIFLYAEQGLGDTYQFIRYAREAKKRGGHVIVAVQRPLIDIIKCCPYIDQVIALNEKCPDFDVYAPLMSLPHILNTTIDTVPQEIPYLYAREELIKTWATRLKDNSNFKVGICWQGNDKYSTPFLRSVVAAKSVPMNQFSLLGSVPGVSIYNLQKETGTEQLKDINQNFKLITFEGDFDNSNGRFMDTAAVMKNLDLVITIDTSIAHIAAGLGVETWVLIPTPPDWRWMLDRPDTPWYPNMRLFRQPTPGDWQSVMETIVQELKKHVELKQYIAQKKEIVISKKAALTVESENTSTTQCLQTSQACQPYKKALQQELAELTVQLKKSGDAIKESTAIDVLHEQFITRVQQFYLLNQMRNTITQHLDLLS